LYSSFNFCIYGKILIRVGEEKMSDGKSFTITAGNYHQLGANYDGEGVNFALFSAHAQRVELCLYAPDGKQRLQGSICRSTPMKSGTATFPD
jgi:pullulanase/glycogen debranching enzyme